MATVGSENLTPGALYELVARGNKDKFFISSDLENAESPFNTTYGSSEPHLGETRTTVPTNDADFGKMVEFQLEVFGDVLTDMYILIDLPSWLPSLPVEVGGTSLPPSEANWQYHITSADDNSYGWIRGIGYLLFEKIQILQDLILIQEISGDSLLALENTQDSNVQYYLRAARAGIHNGTAREIAAAATPGRLRVRIPFPGLQGKYDGGLPLCALTTQNYRVRFWLRRAEQLYESAVATTVAPWDNTFKYVPVFSEATCNGRAGLGKPTLLLETRQEYLTEDQQQELRTTHLKIPFIRYYDETFTIGEQDYVGLDSGGTVVIQRRMEGRHPMERLLFYFRSKQWFSNGQLWRIGGGTDFYNSVGFLVAGTDREYDWSSSVLHTINGLVKDDRFMSLRDQSELRWSIPEGVGPNRQPTGTVNFTTASRPTLVVDLKNVAADPCDNQRTTFMQVVGEAWGTYEIKDGKGRLMFLD